LDGFFLFSKVGTFPEVKTCSVGTLCVKKRCSSHGKSQKMGKGEWLDQQLGDVGVLTSHGKKRVTVTMILHTTQLSCVFVSISRGKEITKPVFVSDYNPPWEGSTQKIKFCNHTYWKKRKVPNGMQNYSRGY
jgi:hypothetical protein